LQFAAAFWDSQILLMILTESGMKTKLILVVFLASGSCASLAGGGLLTPELQRSGEEAAEWGAKLACGTTEKDVTRYGMWEGRMYSRTPGERDRHLFNVFGINVRRCDRIKDPARGSGYRSVSREIMVYLDPQSNQIIDTWRNPWTAVTNNVIHVANDPVNMRRASYAVGEDGKPVTVRVRHYGDTLVSSSEVPLFYDNPLAGAYQDYIGGKYHAMEIFNTYYKTADFLDRKKTRISDSRISWQRVSGWLPWMQMTDRPGLIIFNATGFSTFDKAKIPARITEVIAQRFPIYLEPPPLDDARPNETTWTVTKKQIDSERAAGQKK
jgi:hypothetical protein